MPECPTFLKLPARPAKPRSRGITHVLDAHIDALNYEVGRTGPDDLKPLAENNWSKPFVAGVIDVKSTVTESADEVADRIRQFRDMTSFELEIEAARDG